MLSTQTSSSTVLFWIYCFAIVIPLGSSEYKNAELQVYKDIFDSYNPAIRPLKNSNDTLYVKVTYYLSSIDGVDEKGQIITLSGWLHLEWTDEFLTWDPESYEGVTMIVVPAEKIWTPDLVFESGIKDKFFATKLYWARVSSDGRIAWEPGGTIDFNCNYDLSYYPCDNQTCEIKLVTWANTGNKVYTSGNYIDISNYGANGEWDLDHAQMENVTFEEGGDVYSEVHFFIVMRRKPLYQVLNILLPVTLLSILNLLVFCIPPESGEKVSLSVTVLLAFSVWLLMMNGMMPSSSDYVPIMGMYITAFLVSSSVSVFISVMVLRVYEWPDTRPIPPRIVKVMLKMSNLKCRYSCFAKKQQVRPETPIKEITQLPSSDTTVKVESKVAPLPVETKVAPAPVEYKLLPLEHGPVETKVVPVPMEHKLPPLIDHGRHGDHHYMNHHPPPNHQNHHQHNSHHHQKEGSKANLLEEDRSSGNEAHEQRVTWHQVADGIDIISFFFFLFFFFILTFVTVVILLKQFNDPI